MTNKDAGLGDVTLWKRCDTCHMLQANCACGRESDDFGIAAEPAEVRHEQADFAPRLAAGELVGNYQVLRSLGSGGMSSVYLARHLATEELVALKTLNADILFNEEARLRFEREARAMKRLSHPNLLALKDYGETADGSRYFVMDYLVGRSLEQELDLCRRLEEKRAVAVFLQVCAAMAHVHGAGVIHRDLKPGNIFLVSSDSATEADFVKVLDFGIAKLRVNTDETESNLTKKGQILGSPRYMSPEQCLGAVLDERSDIYSLGCVMYHAVFGDTPFNGEHSLAILYKHVNEAPAGLGEKDAVLNPQLRTVIARCLAKEPEKRFQTMNELFEGLLPLAM